MNADQGDRSSNTSGGSDIRVVQLSDTHFLEPGEAPEGGFAYDVDDAFDAVLDHVDCARHADLVVVTGDLADHGRPAQYRRAADAFGRFASPVNVCPGNHDQALAFAAGIGRPNVSTSRVLEIGTWAFLFVDSCAGIQVVDEVGRAVDPPDYGDRLHSGGALGPREMAWIRETCAAVAAPNVFVWLHHPPTVGDDPRGADYRREWRTLLDELPQIRGMAAGHTHVPDQFVFADRPVFVCPALKNNFDLGAATLLPPGYRSFVFGDEGSISSEVHLTDDDRWPRHPTPRSVQAYLTGELTAEAFYAIVERKRAESQETSATC